MKTKQKCKHNHPCALGPEKHCLNFKEDKIKSSLLLLSQRYNYNRWIYESIRNFIGNDILEVGAGIGNITDFILSKNRLNLIDINEDYTNYLKCKYANQDESRLNIFQANIEHIDASPLAHMTFDTIICLNILEHLENDARAVKNMSRLLRPKGKLIILVPALQSLYGSMDAVFGHYRRYEKKGLSSIISQFDLNIVKLSYFNFLGLLGWYVNGKIFKKEGLPDTQTKIFDKLVPLLMSLERIILPPCGQSIILIAQKNI
jgi:SAM-dependent methyltransferase